MLMNIYLCSQTENEGYDTYDAIVVVAANEDQARIIHPRNYSSEMWPEYVFGKDWWNDPNVSNRHHLIPNPV